MSKIEKVLVTGKTLTGGLVPGVSAIAIAARGLPLARRYIYRDTIGHDP